MTSRCGRRSSASPRTRSGATDHSSLELAHERVGGALAEVDRAAGAERPAPGPRGDPRRAPAGQPAPVGGARDAQRGDAARGVAGDQPQRPAQRLQLDRDPVVRRARKSTSRAATPSWLGEPRSRSASIAASAASVCAGEGSKCSSRQLRAAPARAPTARGRGSRGCSVGVLGGRWGCGRRRVATAESRGQTTALVTHRLARVSSRRRKHWGWGFEDQQPPPEQVRAAAAGLARAPRVRRWASVEQPVALERGRAAARRASRPAGALAEICAADAHARASHALGKSYCDVVRGFRGRFDHPPDFVARPRDEARGRAGARVVLRPSASRRSRSAAARRSSAASRRTCAASATTARSSHRPRRARSRARGRRGLARGAHPGGRARARRSRRQLAEHGLTLRHFPQSFEFSTLGGWIATRAGGHFATRVDAHRGLRRVGARDHAGGRVGVAAAAGLGRGRQPRPDARRLGGHARRDHRGVGARAAATRAPRSAGVRFATSRAGAECVRALASRGCTRRTAACSTRARRR